MLKELPICKTEISIVSNNLNNDISIPKLELEKLFVSEKCRSVMNKIRSNETISQYDLTYLTPFTTGTGIGFIQQNNLINVGIYNYELSLKFEVSCSCCKDCTIKVWTSNNVSIISNNMIYCDCNNFKGCSLPNGLQLFGDKLNKPLFELDDNYYHLWNAILL